jgi:hypothetical protein
MHFHSAMPDGDAIAGLRALRRVTGALMDAAALRRALSAAGRRVAERYDWSEIDARRSGERESR